MDIHQCSASSSDSYYHRYTREIYLGRAVHLEKSREAAVTFLEMLFNDTRIANLFAWGVEGVDYQVGADGVAGYIEGNEEPAYQTVPFLDPN